MAESKDKTIEMRLTEIEDKLAQLHVTDEEMKAYTKVSNLLGSSGGGGGAQLTPDPNSCSQICVIPRMRWINRGIWPRINRFVCECNECTPFGGSGGGFGGGFGGFGL
jgi:hypothetical protein